MEDPGHMQGGFRAITQRLDEHKTLFQKQIDLLHVVSSKLDLLNELMLGLAEVLAKEQIEEHRRQNLPHGPDVPCPRCDSTKVKIPDEDPEVRMCLGCNHAWRFDPDVSVSDLPETTGTEEAG